MRDERRNSSSAIRALLLRQCLQGPHSTLAGKAEPMLRIKFTGLGFHWLGLRAFLARLISAFEADIAIICAPAMFSAARGRARYRI